MTDPQSIPVSGDVVKICPACKGEPYAIAHDLGRPVLGVCARCDGRGYVLDRKEPR